MPHVCPGGGLCSGLVRFGVRCSSEGLLTAADAVLPCARTAELLTKPTTEKLPSDAEGLQASFAKLESVIAQTAAYVDDVVVRCCLWLGRQSFIPQRAVSVCVSSATEAARQHSCWHSVGAVAFSWCPNPIVCGRYLMMPCVKWLLLGTQAGRRKGDRAIGRFLADTVDAVPLVSREDLEVLFNENVQVILCSCSVSNASASPKFMWQPSALQTSALVYRVQDVLLVMYLANLVRAHVSLADKLGTASIPLL